MLLMAESLFAIDTHHDNYISLRDWHPGCDWIIPQGTSFAICFG
jgi:hypothetical protein